MNVSESPRVAMKRGSRGSFPERSGMLIAIVSRARALASIVAYAWTPCTYKHVDQAGATFHRSFCSFSLPVLSLPPPPLSLSKSGEHVEARGTRSKGAVTTLETDRDHVHASRDLAVGQRSRRDDLTPLRSPLANECRHILAIS